jgi:hypothetical protein
MSEEETPQSEGVPLSAEMRAQSGLVVSGFVATGSTTGDQSFEYAGLQIEVEDAAHRREMERQRVERELEKDKREEDEKFIDRKHQRWRDNCTYAVVVGLIIAGLVGSFYVAVTSTDPTRQVWAQGLTTTIAGVVGGAFAGYIIGGKR